MKKLLALFLAVAACQSSWSATVRISQMATTNNIGTNDLIELSVLVGSSRVTRSLSMSNLFRFVKLDATNAATALVNAASNAIVNSIGGSATNIYLESSGALQITTNSSGFWTLSVEPKRFSTNHLSAGALVAFPAWLEYSNAPLTVLNFGDSLAEAGTSPGSRVIYAMQEWFGVAGHAGFNYKQTQNWPWSDHAGVTALTSISGLWPWPIIAATNSGAQFVWTNTVTLSGITATKAELWWIAQPGGGPFDLNLRQGGTTTTFKSLDGFASSPVMRYTNVTFASQATVMQISNTAAGTNYIVGNRLGVESGQGVTGFWLARGGAALTEYTNVSRAVWDPFITNLNPGIVLFHGKEMQDVNAFRVTDTLLKLGAPRSRRDVVNVGSYEWDDTQSSYIEQDFYRTNASYLDNVFVDIHSDFPSASNMVTKALQVSGANPHLTTLGTEAVGDVVLQRLGLSWVKANNPSLANAAIKTEANHFSGQNTFSATQQFSNSVDIIGANAQVTVFDNTDPTGTKFYFIRRNEKSLVIGDAAISTSPSGWIYRIGNDTGTINIYSPNGSPVAYGAPSYAAYYATNHFLSGANAQFSRYLPEVFAQTNKISGMSTNWVVITNGTVTASAGFRNGTSAVQWLSGSGSPESAVTAPVGSLYSRTDGGAGTTLYVKESGTGNTGWVAK